MPAAPTMSAPSPHAEARAEAGERIVDQGATSDQRTYSLIMHLSLAATALSVPPVIAALIMWLIKRDSSTFIDDHGREAVNFQLSMVLYSIILGLVGITTCGLGLITLPIIWILGIVGIIQAAIAANRGEYYRYPMTIRFIS